jgi:hypothetical protein
MGLLTATGHGSLAIAQGTTGSNGKRIPFL